MEAIVFIILQIFFHNTCSFENWGIFLDIPQFKLGNIQSCDAFRPIAHEQKYLMDYKRWQWPTQCYVPRQVFDISYPMHALGVIAKYIVLLLEIQVQGHYHHADIYLGVPTILIPCVDKITESGVTGSSVTHVTKLNTLQQLTKTRMTNYWLLFTWWGRYPGCWAVTGYPCGIVATAPLGWMTIIPPCAPGYACWGCKYTTCWLVTL